MVKITIGYLNFLEQDSKINHKRVCPAKGGSGRKKIKQERKDRNEKEQL